MKSSRALPGAIIVGAVAVASMFAAAPAAAAPALPAGQKISIIDGYDNQYFNVNPSTAFSTPVGTPDLTEEFVSGVDVNDEGLGYAVATFFGEIEIDLAPDRIQAEPEGDVGINAVPSGYPDGGYIFKADANTGKLSEAKQVIIDLPGEEDPYADECSAIDYSKGVVLAVCYDGFDTIFDTAYIGTVDVTSSPDFARLTPLTTLTGERYLNFTAIALNPVDGKLYGFAFPEYGPSVAYVIGLDDSYPEELESDEASLWEVYAADFDRSGQLWVSVYPFSVPSLVVIESYHWLGYFDFATNEVEGITEYNSEAPNGIELPHALTVWGVLAATGSAAPVAPAIAASLILLAGAILAAGTMVLRRRSAEVL